MTLSELYRKACEFEHCEISKTNNQFKHGRRAQVKMHQHLDQAIVKLIEAAGGIEFQTDCVGRPTPSRLIELSEALTELRAVLLKEGK